MQYKFVLGRQSMQRVQEGLAMMPASVEDELDRLRQELDRLRGEAERLRTSLPEGHRSMGRSPERRGKELQHVTC